MKEIGLTQGKVALVDDGDYIILNRYKWHAVRDKTTFYAKRHISLNGKRIISSMQAIIMDTPKGMDTDHINGDGLDNRRENLRVVSHRQNCQNKYCHRLGKVVGVEKRDRKSPYRARIRVNGKRIPLGCYQSEMEANYVYGLACWLFSSDNTNKSKHLIHNTTNSSIRGS